MCQNASDYSDAANKFVAYLTSMGSVQLREEQQHPAVHVRLCIVLVGLLGWL